HERMGENLIERGERPDHEAVGNRRDALHRFDVLDIDDPLGTDTAGPQQVEEVGPAGQHGGISAMGRKQLDRLFFGAGAGIFEGIHARPPFRASRTRLGVRGRTLTRTPIALATAFEMAAPGEMTGGSPSPTTPRSYSLLGWYIFTTSSPTSPIRG